MKSIILLYLVSSFLLNSLCAAQWDREYWQYVEMQNWACGPYKVYTVAEARLRDDLSKFYYLRITGNLAYRALPEVDLEAHYSYIHYRPKTAGLPFVTSQRLEFEINPFMVINKDWQLKWRNRLELIKKEGVPGLRSVFRHRVLIALPIENRGKWVKFAFFDEIFYDLKRHYFTQNRFVPCQFTFALSRHTHMDVFLMIRHFNSANIGYRSCVLGSTLSF